MREAQSPAAKQDTGRLELPKPTAAPLVLATGATLLASGLIFGLVFVAVGLAVLLCGLWLWLRELQPGNGHDLVAVEKAHLAAPPVGPVLPLTEASPGYRLLLPIAVHPVSAGVKGGAVGGLVMPIPALLWSLLSGHGLWYPINLLAGVLLPGVEEMSVAQLMAFQPLLLGVGAVIHVSLSLVIGLIYGVLLPTLPKVPRAIAWGALLAPLLWSGLTYASVNVLNAGLAHGISWPWFIASQYLFGLAAATIILGLPGWPAWQRGLVAAAGAGMLMPLPVIVWSLALGHGLWYPVNLLAGLLLPRLGDQPLAAMDQFEPAALLVGLSVHVFMSLTFGMALALFHDRLPRMGTALVWGGLVLPLLWTGVSFGLMGVVNPVLQERVDWPWFILSQFVFGVAAALVVEHTEMVPVQPAVRRT